MCVNRNTDILDSHEFEIRYGYTNNCYSFDIDMYITVIFTIYWYFRLYCFESNFELFISYMHGRRNRGREFCPPPPSHTEDDVKNGGSHFFAGLGPPPLFFFLFKLPSDLNANLYKLQGSVQNRIRKIGEKTPTLIFT